VTVALFLTLGRTPPAPSSTGISVGEALLIGALASLIASIVFLALLRVLRPKLAIAKKAAWTRDPDTQKRVYRVKICNKSRFEAVNVKIELYRIERSPASPTPRAWWEKLFRAKDLHSELTHRHKIWAGPRELTVLEGYRIRDTTAHYAFRFKCDDDLMASVGGPNNSFVRVRVYAEHPISRRVRLFEQEFLNGNAFAEGSYLLGRSMEIEPPGEHPDGDGAPV
jgi:hypothetical protein